MYINFQDLDSSYIGYYSIKDFSVFSNKAVENLKRVLKSKLGSILPIGYQFQNDFGGGNLQDDLVNFISHCKVLDFQNAVSFLYRIVYYQVQNGFWDKDLNIDKKSKIDDVLELESKLKISTEILNQNIELNKKLIDELENEKGILIQFINTKQSEISEISSLIPTARNNTEEISRLLTTSTDSNQQILGLLNQQNSNLETVKLKLEEERNIFNLFHIELKEIKENYKEIVDKTSKNNIEFEKLLETVKNKSSTFEERISVLNELIGKEGAVKLFSTFNDRKEELDKPVKKWANIVFYTGSIALALIVGIFTNFFGRLGGFPTEINWQFLIINSLKSLPVMVVLTFTIRQYIKERSFQEEYAFRSAIALTVQAYGDIAGKNKDELISKAVDSIYTMPSMMRTKSSVFSIRGKGLTESIKELSEAVKNFKG